MLAILNLTSLRNNLAATLPTTGDMSWMEEYFIVGMACMFVNLCSHIASFAFEARKLPQVRRLCDAAGLFLVAPLFLLTISVELHRRECDHHVPFEESLALVVVSALICVVCVALLLRWHH